VPVIPVSIGSSNQGGSSSPSRIIIFIIITGFHRTEKPRNLRWHPQNVPTETPKRAMGRKITMPAALVVAVSRKEKEICILIGW